MANHSLNQLLISCKAYGPDSHVERLQELVSNAPSREHQRAILHSAVVLLAASYEAYVESLFNGAAERIHQHLAANELSVLLRTTSGRLHSPNADNVNKLFYILGIPDVANRVRWSGFSNKAVRREIEELIQHRNLIAHGSHARVTAKQVSRWREVVERATDALFKVVNAHIQEHHGN